MTTCTIENSTRRDVLARPARFVLVNERIPRAAACCTSCCVRIERGYVRDPQTRLVYCTTECFTEHEKQSMPATTLPSRRVS